MLPGNRRPTAVARCGERAAVAVRRQARRCRTRRRGARRSTRCEPQVRGSGAAVTTWKLTANRDERQLPARQRERERRQGERADQGERPDQMARGGADARRRSERRERGDAEQQRGLHDGVGERQPADPEKRGEVR